VVLSEDVGSVLEELRQKNAALVDRMFSPDFPGEPFI